MARTRRALAVPSSRGWRLRTASRTFRVLHRLHVILSLRRIRDPSARRDELRILRLRSQARFAQDDTALPDRVRNFRNPRVGRSIHRVKRRGRAAPRPCWWWDIAALHQSFGFVQMYDTEPKRRLFEVLRPHGLQMNQEVVFFNDSWMTCASRRCT